MTNATTTRTITASTLTSADAVNLETAAITHLDDPFELAFESLLTQGISGSLICDGSCGGTASCCIAPVAPATQLAA